MTDGDDVERLGGESIDDVRVRAVAVEGESLREAASARGVHPQTPVEWRGQLYNPVWPGCVECTLEREEQNEDRTALDPRPGEGVFAHAVDGEEQYLCSCCRRMVDRRVDAVEVITDRWGPADSETERVLLDRVVGFEPVDENCAPEALEAARDRWIGNARAVLAVAGLVEADKPALTLGGGEAEFW